MTDLAYDQPYVFPPGVPRPRIPPETSRSRPLASPAARRLYWTLAGPLHSSAITVMPEDENPDAPREPYFRGADDWHPISREPMCADWPQASITVHESKLQDWRHRWWDEFVAEGYDEEEPELMAEYEEGMPPTFDEPIVVHASDGRKVTVHDFVSAVHPWLMGHRDNIVRATKNSDEGASIAGDERLMVVVVQPHSLSAWDEDEWHRSLKSACEKRQREPQPRFPQEPAGGPVVRPLWEEWGKNTWVLRRQEIPG